MREGKPASPDPGDASLVYYAGGNTCGNSDTTDCSKRLEDKYVRPIFLSKE